MLLVILNFNESFINCFHQIINNKIKNKTKKNN